MTSPSTTSTPGLSIPAQGSLPCPTCKGAPVAHVEGCCGCIDCDFTGTLEAYERTQKMVRESNEALAAYIKAGVCSTCGAKCAREAQTMCRPSQDHTGEYYCNGEDLWEDDPEPQDEEENNELSESQPREKRTTGIDPNRCRDSLR